MSKQRNITRDFLVVVLVVVFGKVLGFARELVVAYLYGSSVDTDAFYYVNSLITAIFSIITMGLGQAFTPTYLDTKIKKGEDNSKRFADKIVTILTIIGIVLAVMLCCAPQLWLSILAPDLNSETALLAEKMLRLMSPCVVLYILFSIRKCILNAHEKYIITEASGIPYSIAISLFTLVLYSSLNSMALPVAALIGVLFQYLFSYVFSRKDYKYSPCKLMLHDEEIKNYFIMLVPIATSAVLEEANGLLRKSLAGGIGDGAISNLSYCMTLTTLINGIVITSISTVYFPHLIKNFSEGKTDEFKKNVGNCISMASILVIPIVSYLLVFSKQVVKIVYERGNFTASDTEQVAALFSIYVVGSIIYAYRCIIKTSFFATKDAKTPMINEMLYLIICMACNVVQVKVFGLGLNALGIAWVASITIMTPVLFVKFRKMYFGLITTETVKEFIKACIATVLFSALNVVMIKYISFTNVWIEVIVTGVVSVLVYIVSMLLLKSSFFIGIKKSVVERIKHNG